MGGGQLHVTTEALDDAATRISRFLVAQSLINASYGVLVFIGLWFIDMIVGGGRNGVVTALLAGSLCAVLRFVPYVGAWLGAALPLALAFAAFPGNGVFFSTLGMFIVVEVVVSQAVEPKLLGSSTGIAPMAVLVATVFWTWLWGPIGLLLSTPLTVLLVVMGKYVPQLEFLDVLLGDRPVLDPPTRVYQRLIAGDDEEAVTLAQGYLKEMSLEAVYDRVLIPALAKAQFDWRKGKVDESRHALIIQGFREIAEALGEQQSVEDNSAASVQPEREAKGTGEPESDALPVAGPATGERPPLPRSVSMNVLCLPAQGEADEVAALMLSQLLERRGYRVTTAAAEATAGEVAEQIGGSGVDVVVVSALPPKAVMHARYLVKRLSARYPQLKVVVGLWADAQEAHKAQVSVAGTVKAVTTFDEAQDQLDELATVRP
jgi:CheY-like chemotaxis protein